VALGAWLAGTIGHPIAICQAGANAVGPGQYALGRGYLALGDDPRVLPPAIEGTSFTGITGYQGRRNRSSVSSGVMVILGDRRRRAWVASQR
jgi:hypothetical protein